MRISPITEPEATTWCKQALTGKQNPNSPENQAKLIEYFHMASRRNWFALTDLLLAAKPIPLPEMEVLKFCQDAQRNMPTLARMHERTAEHLQQVYMLSINNKWNLVSDFLKTHKLVGENLKKIDKDLQQNELPTAVRPRQ